MSRSDRTSLLKHLNAPHDYPQIYSEQKARKILFGDGLTAKINSK